MKHQLSKLRPRLRLPGNPLNTLFGRMVILMVIMLIADHSVWLITFARERPHQYSSRMERGALLTISALRQLDMLEHSANPDPVQLQMLRAALGDVRRVDVDAPDAPHATDAPDFKAHRIFHRTPLFRHCSQGVSAEMTQSLQQDLPPGTQVAFSPPPQMETWILLPGSHTWYGVPPDGPPPGGAPYKAVFIELGMAIVFAIVAAWQLQKPLAELARAAINFRPNRPPFKVRERGPREVKRVIHHFNETVKELYENEQDREVMLAGVAHDLRAPITRVRARAEVIADERLANGFIRDADSLSQIVDRFLDFSKLSVDERPPLSVEAFCSALWGSPESHLEWSAEIHLKFKAGEAFRLPVTDIERIVSNLIENAIAYGIGPIEIRTGRALDDRPERLGGPKACWELTVRDHGQGIPAEKLEQAMRPFVRLDASRGGDAHCGLGLAIVNKLVQRHDGTLKLSNAPDGGLQVTMRFPAEPGAI